MTIPVEGHGPFHCFARGSRISTSRGELAVEALEVGEPVALATGGAAPITWIGHRDVDCDSHPAPAAAWPVRVCAGAIGEGLPASDLWVSPRQALLVDGALIPVERLINGRTIVQEPRSSVQYWDVEIEAQDAILAEGLPVASSLDPGDRGVGARWPYAEDGPALLGARVKVHERALELGHLVGSEADPHLLADGERIEPIRISEHRLCFAIPPGRQEILLASRAFVPAHTDPASADRRALGLCIGRLQVDGSDVALESAEHFGAGWHAAEDEGLRRWTSGRGGLPAGAQLILIDSIGDGRYWVEPRDNVVPFRRPA